MYSYNLLFTRRSGTRYHTDLPYPVMTHHVASTRWSSPTSLMVPDVTTTIVGSEAGPQGGGGCSNASHFELRAKASVVYAVTVENFRETSTRSLPLHRRGRRNGFAAEPLPWSSSTDHRRRGCARVRYRAPRRSRTSLRSCFVRVSTATRNYVMWRFR